MYSFMVLKLKENVTINIQKYHYRERERRIDVL